MGIPPINQKIITPKHHAEWIQRDSLNPSLVSLTADVVVIGSGAGGAVVCAELAKKGRKVVLLEEGPYLTPAQFNSDEFLSLSRMYRDAGFIVAEDQTLNIAQGRTVGGSTTVNWQTSLYPPDYVTEEWATRFGWVGYSRSDMDPYIREVHDRLGVHPVPKTLVNPNNNVLWVGGQKLGLHPEILENNNRGCIGLGRCGLGCPINAKQSTYLTWIPDALAHGATVISNMRVVKIHDGVQKKVIAEFSPDAYEENPSQIIERIEVSAPIVVVSAGAIEGPALLQRSGLGNEWVGRNLKVHPTASVFARYPREIRMHSGPPQSVVIKDGHNQDGSGYGFWLEVAPYRPTLFASLVPFYGEEQFRVMEDYNHFSAGIVLVRDGADGETRGSVEWSFGKRKVHYELTPTDGRNLLRGILSLVEVSVASGATEVILPFPRFTKPFSVSPGMDWSWILKERFDPGYVILGSAHPHGSIQAAHSPTLGAIAPNLELYGHPGIFVMDASVYPTGLSVNPQITTMAIALKASRGMVLGG